MGTLIVTNVIKVEECDDGKIECDNCEGDGTYTCPYCNE
jgi:hypothetical protein